jgi:hypothetical protein
MSSKRDGQEHRQQPQHERFEFRGGEVQNIGNRGQRGLESVP